MRIVTILALTLTLLMPTFSFGAEALGPSEKHSKSEGLKGKVIPNFYVLAIDNATELSKKKLAEEAKKQGAKRIVFSFFATWCVENCGAEFVKLKENVGKLKENGVSVYLIDVGEKIMQKGKLVSEFVSEFAGNAFPFYFDDNVSLLKDLGIIERNAVQAELPIIVIMDADLKILSVFDRAGNDFPQILWSDL